ncbi:4229_t:CDS:2, partial [Dentiscutata heterogama]
NLTPLANPEIEFLEALELFDSPEIAETILSPEAEREYLEALEILKPILQFHQNDIISSGCELLNDYYQVEIGKESIYAQDPINTLGEKWIEQQIIKRNDPKTGEPAQHYFLIQGRDGLGKLAGYTTKHKDKLYVCDYYVSHQTHNSKIDAQHIEDSDAETLSIQIEKNQGSKTIAIQEHKVIGFDYIIKCSDGKTKVPVKIRGDDPAGDVRIRKNDEENLIRIKNELKGLYQAHRRDPLGVDIGIMYCLANTIYCRLRWPGEPMKKLTTQEEKIHNSAKKCYIYEKPFGKEDNLKKVQDHDHITGNYRGPAHSICNFQLRIKPKQFELPIHFHNLGKFDAYLISQAIGLDIENQRYMDSLQLMPGSLDSHISNLGAELYKEEVDKDENSLNLLYKTPENIKISKEEM